jgi:hypothetical protein
VNLRQSPRGLATGKDGGSFSKEGRHVATLELPTEQHIALRIDAVNLKNRLRDIETDCRNRLNDLLLRIVGALTAPTSMALTVPLEEPSTASTADKVHRCNLCCHLGYTGTGAISAQSKLENEGASIRLQHLRRAACDPLLALIFRAASFVPRRSILGPRPQVTRPRISRLRL